MDVCARNALIINIIQIDHLILIHGYMTITRESISHLHTCLLNLYLHEHSFLPKLGAKITLIN